MGSRGLGLGLEVGYSYFLGITSGRNMADICSVALTEMAPPSPSVCQNPFVPEDFWNDMAWLNIPRERETLFIPPLFPRGGLLGGSPDAVPKMSKLQALAAARKKKALEQKSSAGVEEVEKPLAKMDIGRVVPEVKEKHEESTSVPAKSDSGKRVSRSYPERKRKNSSPHAKISQPAEPAEMDTPGLHLNLSPSATVEQAPPSAFASIMFGGGSSAPLPQPTRTHFTLPYCADSSVQSTDAFAGPSPDDVVIAAQSKGSGHSEKQRK